MHGNSKILCHDLDSFPLEYILIIRRDQVIFCDMFCQIVEL